ncbi:MAG: hypothetical protein MHMPM18_001527 [Marteilia pararefringens]
MTIMHKKSASELIFVLKRRIHIYNLATHCYTPHTYLMRATITSNIDQRAFKGMKITEKSLSKLDIKLKQQISLADFIRYNIYSSIIIGFCNDIIAILFPDY